MHPRAQRMALRTLGARVRVVGQTTTGETIYERTRLILPPGARHFAGSSPVSRCGRNVVAPDRPVMRRADLQRIRPDPVFKLRDTSLSLPPQTESGLDGRRADDKERACLTRPIVSLASMMRPEFRQWQGTTSRAPISVGDGMIAGSVGAGQGAPVSAFVDDRRTGPL